MTDKLYSLAGKYFINRQQLPNGGWALSRGQVLGPVHEFMPLYLCSIEPPDDKQLAIAAQQMIPLEILTSAYFYDDRVLWLEDWREMIVTIEQGQKEEDARRQAAWEKRQAAIAQATIEALAKGERGPGIAQDGSVAFAAMAPDGKHLDAVMIPGDEMEKLLRALQGGGRVSGKARLGQPRRPRRRTRRVDESEQEQESPE